LHPQLLLDYPSDHGVFTSIQQSDAPNHSRAGLEQAVHLICFSFC
jgi:hypothetical protein